MKASIQQAIGSPGYTLLEIILVINLLSIALLPVYPILDRQYQGMLLHQEARHFVAFLETRRQEAILSSPQWNTTASAYPVIRINNGGKQHSYVVSQGAIVLERVNLPETVKIETNLTNNQFVYNRHGVPNRGGTVSLTNGRGMRIEIVIHLFTGIVEIKG